MYLKNFNHFTMAQKKNTFWFVRTCHMYINSTRYTTCSVNVSWEFWEVVLCQFYKFYNGGMSLLKKNIPHFLLFSGSTCTFFGTDFVTHSSHIMMFSFSEGSSVVGNVLFLQLLHVLYMQDISLSLHTLACTMSLGEDVATIPNWCSFFIFRPKF